MRPRARLLVAGALSPMLLGLWAAFVLFLGAPPAASGGTGVSAPAAAAASSSPARAETAHRASSVRAEVRRAPVAAVAEVIPAEPAGLPPAPLPAPPAEAVSHQPPAGGESADPRRERAPPQPAPFSRHSRAPPSTPSS
ncbi:hypothetical protein [Streptomyces sp. CAU 1734]|uniref:hypothetical protein n=1 Tax=Streptomyces sp. CAU 1734 TaxID=3140360 RepID=UPI00326145C2